MGRGYYRNDSTSSLIAILIYSYPIGKGYQYVLTNWLHIKINPWYLFWILIYPLTLVILIFLFWGIGWLANYIKEKRFNYKQARQVCKHNIIGGETLAKCEKCKWDKILLERKKNNERIAIEKKKELNQKADDLRLNEYKRLLKLKLTKQEYLLSLQPNEFEDIVSKMFENLGYKVNKTPYTNDRGKDAVFFKNNRKFVAEYKKYKKENTIGRRALQIFFAAMQEEKAEKGFFVTTSDFKKTAIEYASTVNIDCINIDRLLKLMGAAFPEKENYNYNAMCRECGNIVLFDLKNSESSKVCEFGHTVNLDINIDDISINILTQKKICYSCGKEMKLTNGFYGKYWRCSGYPNCKRSYSAKNFKFKRYR
ncbi:MAG: restriction endonuclease [Bacteroidetes bacterium]|nr:restriction endonuclease [Bacteroidota bacterium]